MKEEKAQPLRLESVIWGPLCSTPALCCAVLWVLSVAPVFQLPLGFLLCPVLSPCLPLSSWGRSLMSFTPTRAGTSVIAWLASVPDLLVCSYVVLLRMPFVSTSCSLQVSSLGGVHLKDDRQRAWGGIRASSVTAPGPSLFLILHSLGTDPTSHQDGVRSLPLCGQGWAGSKSKTCLFMLCGYWDGTLSGISLGPFSRQGTALVLAAWDCIPCLHG